VDPKLSTIQRLAVALGGKVEWRFVSADAVPAAAPSEQVDTNPPSETVRQRGVG